MSGYIIFSSVALFWRIGISSVADVIQRHRTEHAQNVLIAACREAIATGNVESVVERFINPSQVTA